MARISMLCVVSSTLVAFALANGASAFTLGESTPKVTVPSVKPPVKPNVSGTAKVQGLSNTKNLPAVQSQSGNVPAVQSQQK